MESENMPSAASSDAILDELRTIRELLSEQSAAALGREAAARYLQISKATLERLTSAGKVKSVMVSAGRRVWRRADLEKYLNELGD
jgi:excisionase family DNA binding protein